MVESGTAGIHHVETTVEANRLTKTEFEDTNLHELASGNAFPGAPSERDIFYRNDLHEWYIYDGTGWVSLTVGLGGSETITGTWTFDLNPAAPFVVTAGSAKVANLDSDLLDGLDSLDFVKADGSVPLSANWDVGAFTITGTRFISDIAIGTAPFGVTSTTVVPNLNVDQVDGVDIPATIAEVLTDHDKADHDALNIDADTLDSLDSLKFVKEDGTVPLSSNWDVGAFTITGTRFISDIAIGTAPFGVTSTTVVANLNVDQVDGVDIPGTVANVLSDLALNEVFSHASQPLNSKGNSFATIQATLNDLAGAGWVYAPTGNWAEEVTIADADVILYGAGWSTKIGTGSAHGITMNGARCVVRDLQVFTTAGGGIVRHAVRMQAADGLLDNVWISESDYWGVYVAAGGTNSRLRGCRIEECDTAFMSIYAQTDIGGNMIFAQSDSFGIVIYGTGDNSVLQSFFMDTTGDDGILIDGAAENCVIDSARIINWTNEAIDDNSGTSTIGDIDTT